MENTLARRCLAEAFGTFWLVFGGCGSAVLAAAFPGLGIGFAGVAKITSAGSPPLFQRTSREVQLALKLYF